MAHTSDKARVPVSTAKTRATHSISSVFEFISLTRNSKMTSETSAPPNSRGETSAHLRRNYDSIEAMTTSKNGTRIIHIETSIDQLDYIVMTVADSGPGVDAKLGDQIFEPFLATKSGGIGLGLSICKSIIDDMADD